MVGRTMRCVCVRACVRACVHVCASAHASALQPVFFLARGDRWQGAARATSRRHNTSQLSGGARVCKGGEKAETNARHSGMWKNAHLRVYQMKSYHAPLPLLSRGDSAARCTTCALHPPIRVRLKRLTSDALARNFINYSGLTEKEQCMTLL